MDQINLKESYRSTLQQNLSHIGVACNIITDNVKLKQCKVSLIIDSKYDVYSKRNKFTSSLNFHHFQLKNELYSIKITHNDQHHTKVSATRPFPAIYTWKYQIKTLHSFINNKENFNFNYDECSESNKLTSFPDFHHFELKTYPKSDLIRHKSQKKLFPKPNWQL